MKDKQIQSNPVPTNFPDTADQIEKKKFGFVAKKFSKMGLLATQFKEGILPFPEYAKFKKINEDIRNLSALDQKKYFTHNFYKSNLVFFYFY